MSVTQNLHYQQLMEVRSLAEAAALGERIRTEGFTALRRLLDEFRDYLRRFTDNEGERAEELLLFASTAIPEPGRISPSWAYIWQEYERIIRTKRYLFQTIPAADRDGEWQVLLDNPHSNQNIAVYPALTFLESIYMFAYFRTDLTNNEYIRLQKIANVVTFTGADQEGLV
ncbi:hypothetical protein ACFPYJ_04945 [Paenibacillus solisilvae]|uniref:DUF2313 domain-containing protein n=1 Tax=Paenibacillus solisilvae TaxID=2486751 RepID=A0ABW0VWP0_9BACL